jgi:tetratricopeptide (TPR) repeat protein
MAINQIALFIEKLESFKDTWFSMETKVLTGKVENRWVNLGTIIRLSSEEKQEREEELFRLKDRIMILQKVEKSDFSKLKVILENLSKSIKMKNIEIFSEGLGDFQYITKEKENWKEDRITDIEEWPACLLRSYGKNPRELLKNVDEIDESLRANVEPYEDLCDLSSNYIFAVGGPYVIGIYVIAPIYIRFEKLTLNASGKLEATIKFHKSIAAEDFKMNVILSSHSASSDRFQLLFKQEGRPEGEFLVVDEAVERDLSDVKGARTYFFYKDSLIRTDWTSAVRPSDEKQLREDILGAIQKMKESFSYIENALGEIELAVLNAIIDIEDNVKDKSVWNDLGIYFIENGLYRQAEYVYVRMIDTINKYEKIKGKRIHKGLAFHNLGVVLLHQNRREEAKKMFEQAYEEDKITYGVAKAEQMQAREALRKILEQ